MIRVSVRGAGGGSCDLLPAQGENRADNEESRGEVRGKGPGPVFSTCWVCWEALPENYDPQWFSS